MADLLIDRVNDLLRHLHGSLTWDQGAEMANEAAVTVATVLSIHLAHPHSPGEQLRNITSGLIREHLPKGVDIIDRQRYLDEDADEVDEGLCQTLGFLTPCESLKRLLVDNAVAMTD